MTARRHRCMACGRVLSERVMVHDDSGERRGWWCIERRTLDRCFAICAERRDERKEPRR